MIINAAKTKVMQSNEKTLDVLVDGGKLEQTDTFEHLGSRIRNDANDT